MEIFDGCQNPKGCGKIATVTLEVTDGEATERARLCAYCAANVREDARNDHLDITTVE